MPRFPFDTDLMIGTIRNQIGMGVPDFCDCDETKGPIRRGICGDFETIHVDVVVDVF
jgi:hypothetical protein